MSLNTALDVPIRVKSEYSTSERRISPSWTVAHFKTRLEPITGIPASAQELTLRVRSQDERHIEARDEEVTQLASFQLEAYAEIYVRDNRPATARTDFSDVSAVPKYTMPEVEYESRKDSVLAWKKAKQLGRFDPDAPSTEEQKVRNLEQEVEERGEALSTIQSNFFLPFHRIRASLRCRLLPATDHRRGAVAYVGPVPELPGPRRGPWVGVVLDEPTGRNDGTATAPSVSGGGGGGGGGGGTRYFACAANCGVFVRPERVEVGDFPVLGLEEEGDLEEI